MKYFITTVSTLLLALQCFGWSQKGHDTTCAIAENHLTTKTKSCLMALLDGKSLIYCSNWLDNASNTPEYAYTKTWHYKNIDEGQTFDNAPIAETGNIEIALTEQVDKLMHGGLAKADEQLALKMVIHLMGDLHQPMHLGHKSDRGGNQHMVTFFNRQCNLHELWDGILVESAHKWSHGEWCEEIDRLTIDQIKEIEQGNIHEWGSQTYEICKEVYADSPVDSKLSYSYVAKWTPVIEQQFIRGGVRLAYILNSIYDNK